MSDRLAMFKAAKAQRGSSSVVRLFSSARICFRLENFIVFSLTNGQYNETHARGAVFRNRKIIVFTPSAFCADKGAAESFESSEGKGSCRGRSSSQR